MSMGTNWPRALLSWSIGRTHNLNSYGNAIYNNNYNIHNDHNIYNDYNINNNYNDYNPFYNDDDFYNYLVDIARTNRLVARW